MGVDKRHIAFILFGLLIHQSEDALGARQIAMTMALIWLEIWEMGILKLRESTMKAIRLPSVSRELPDETHSSPADDCQHRILHIAKIVVDGVEHIGKFSGAVGVDPKAPR